MLSLITLVDTLIGKLEVLPLKLERIYRMVYCLGLVRTSVT
jgi:hypothetical protein